MNKQIRFHDSERFFACPICNDQLYCKTNSLVCGQQHCYDISKHGYVNFLPHMKKQTGYNKASFASRRYVLENGFYQFILEEIVAFIQHTPTINTILDVGCGEGYFAKAIYHRTKRCVCAFDVSKQSIQLAAKGSDINDIKWFVADLANIPMQANSVDCILNIFTPANYKEFHKVLKANGYVIKVIPTAKHLQEIRKIVSKQLKNKEYANQRVIDCFEASFRCVARKKVSHTFSLSNEAKAAILEMTPLLFHVASDHFDFSDMAQVTIEAEILIGVLK